MVALSAAFAAVIEDAYVHANAYMPALSNLIFQTEPKEFFKKLNRSGPEYEKKGDKRGKHYRSLLNVRKTWKGEGVLETKVLQYVPQDIRDRFKKPATPLPASASTTASPGDTLAPAVAPPSTPPNRSTIIDIQNIVAQLASQTLASQQHNDRERAEDRKLHRQHMTDISSRVETLAVNTEQRFNLLEDRDNNKEVRLNELSSTVSILWEKFEEEEKEKLHNAEKQEDKEKSKPQVVFATRNEYFTIPARASAKKRKPALTKKDDQSTSTQPVARSTRSRGIQGSTPTRTTRSSSRRVGK